MICIIDLFPKIFSDIRSMSVGLSRLALAWAHHANSILDQIRVWLGPVRVRVSLSSSGKYADPRRMSLPLLSG